YPLVIRKSVRDGVQSPAKKRSRVRIWIASGVAVNPKLVASPNLSITLQGVDHRSPGHERIAQAVHKYDRNSMRIVLLQSHEASGVFRLFRMRQPRKAEFFRMLPRYEHGDGSGEVGGKSSLFVAQRDVFRLKRIDEFKICTLSVELEDGCDWSV